MKRTSALLVVSSLLLGLLLVCLVRADTGAPSRADEPQGPPLIPRHRAGHRAKVQNLDEILAQAEGGDPLSGNYTLARDDEILLGLRDSQGIMQWQYYEVDRTLDATDLWNTLYFDGDSPALATGNFDGDRLDDFVGVRKRGTAIYMTLGYFQEGLYDVTYGFDTGEWAYEVPRVATGDLDGDRQDEIVMAWEGGGEYANLKVYDPVGSIHPAARAKLHDEQVANGNLDAATGDFDGDGNDEVVLAWTDLGNWLGVKIYDVGQDGNLSPKARWNGEGCCTVAVTTGDLNKDGIDEIATVDGQYLRIFQVSNDLGTLTSKSKQSWNCSGVDDPSVLQVDVAAGDFDTDGQDEVVSSCHDGGGVLVSVWASGSGLGLTRKASWHKEITYTRQGSLAVGDLNRDLRAEIVVGWAQQNDLWSPSTQHNYLQILQVDTELGSIAAKGQRDLGAAAVHSHLSVALADLNGDSLRVGPPTYQYLEQAVQNLAVINAPPKHRDVIDGETYDVNVTDRCPSPPCTYAKYETQAMTTTQMSLTTTRDWGVSSELDLEFPFVKASLEASYGQNFEKTTSSFKTMAFGQEVEANEDDAIVRTQQELDVWEYPVYADDSDVVEGHILVAWPRKADPTCTSNCSADVIATLDGRSPNALYRPDHEYGNVLSYSPDDPTNIKTTIKADAMRELGINSYEMWVEWSDVKEDEDKKASKLDLKASLELHPWGQELKTTGSYAQGEVSVHKVSFETETSIHLYLYGIEQRYSYKVRPLFYWAKPDGHLVLDYAVAPVTGSPPNPPTWWQNTYDKPDPAFNLPWQSHPLTPDYELLSREITFDPYSPTAGEPVTITARVRNYSLVPADDVTVRLYRGDPDDGGQRIGSEQTIPELLGRTSQTVTVTFDTSDYAGQTLDIYAVVDPDQAISEVHDEASPPNNNKAYALLPVKPAEAVGRPISLAVAEDKIEFDPRAPGPGATVHISATIQALGAAFTQVAVEFWDGNPRRGGQLIGGDLIPMILAGETATARVAWDTAGEQGTHDIWVNVEHRAWEEDLYDDNWAHRAIELAPFRQYLPLVSRQS